MCFYTELVSCILVRINWIKMFFINSAFKLLRDLNISVASVGSCLISMDGLPDFSNNSIFEDRACIFSTLFKHFLEEKCHASGQYFKFAVTKVLSRVSFYFSQRYFESCWQHLFYPSSIFTNFRYIPIKI